MRSAAEYIKILSEFKKEFGAQFGIKELGIFGSVISHEYSSIDEAVIFAIIKQSLLPLRLRVSQIIALLQ